MIEEVYLRDFQKHRRLRLVLDPFVSVLVGTNGAGKSSVLRAIRWALTNKPQGNRMIGRWRKAPYALVKVRLDKQSIARKKGKGLNEYYVDGKKLKAFGTNTPQAVGDLANVGPVNFQWQHEGPYGLSLSAADASRLLNSVVNLGSIDASLKIAATKVRRAKARMDVTQERLQEARAGRDRYEWAERLSSRISAFEQRTAQIATIATELRQTQDFLSLVSQASYALDRALRLNRTVLRAERAIDLARQSAAELEQLVDTEQAITRARSARRPVPDPARFVELHTAAKKSETELRQMQALSFGIMNQTWESERCQNLLKELDRDLSALMKERGRCKACGQPLPRKPSASASPTPIGVTPYPAQGPRAGRSGIPSRKATASKSGH